jgi:PPOX class probable F420-dependent enzyme
MAQAIPDKYLDLFKKTAFGNLATIMKDGSPQVTPVWVDYDGKYVRFNSALGRVKDKNIRRDPRVALSIFDPENPYRHLDIRGRVVEITRRRGRAHQQPGEEISGQGCVSVSPAGRSARDVQDRTAKSEHNGVGRRKY